MTEKMREELDGALQSVRDPESGYPIARLGVVERFRYNSEKEELYVFTTFSQHNPSCMACVGIAATVIGTIRRELQEELERRFPHLTVLLVEV